MKKKIILGAFTILIVFVVIAIALITNAKNKEEQLKTEMLNILLQKSTSNNAELEKMLDGKGDFGELYFKIKNNEEFQRDIDNKIKALLGDKISAANYDSIKEKTHILDKEGLWSENAKKSINDYKNMVVKQYSTDILKYIENGDGEQLSEALVWLFKENAVYQCFSDFDEILDKILEKSQIYIVKSDVGGYYDNIDLADESFSRNIAPDWLPPTTSTSSSYKEFAFGDFCLGKSTETMVDEGTKGTYLESKYNFSNTAYKLFLRGQSVNGYGYCNTFVWAADQGAEYIVCMENNSESVDSILLLSKNKIFPMTSYTDNLKEYILEGDFSRILNNAEKLYKEKFSQEASIKQAIKHMNNNQYKEAVDIFKYYTHIETVENYIYTMAIKNLREDKSEEGLDILKYVKAFSAIRGKTMDYMISNLDKEFKSDAKYKGSYPWVFCRLMMEVVGKMTTQEIKDTFSNIKFKSLPYDTMYFKDDGTGYELDRFGRDTFDWKVKNDTLLLEYLGGPIEYSVYNIIDGYYVLFYKPEYSTGYITLLKK